MTAAGLSAWSETPVDPAALIPPRYRGPEAKRPDRDETRQALAALECGLSRMGG